MSGELAEKSPQSIDAFLAEARALRELGIGDPAYVELIHARGLLWVKRDAAAEKVLRSAIEATSGDTWWRAHLLVDLAEHCSRRRESATVLDLAARAEAMCAKIAGLSDNAEFRVALLTVRCQAWIDLGRLERMAALADELARLAPTLAPESRQAAALQRCSALLASLAWSAAEQLAREELAAVDVTPELRAKWRLLLGAAVSQIARLEPERGAEARVELEAALDSGLLEPHEHDSALLTAAELAVRERAFALALARLDGFAARHAEVPSPDVEHRATCESLRIEVALERRSERAELARWRDAARATVDAMHTSWRERPSVPGGQSFLLFSAARLLLGQLARLEIELDGERVGVERAIAAFAHLQTAGTAARELDLGRIDADRLRSELLADGATLLVLLPNSLRTHLFVLTPDGALAAEGAAREKVDVLRGALASRLLTRPAPESASRAESLRAAAAGLRDALFDGRVIAELQARPVVVVVGDDLLGGLPIEALDLGGRRAFGVERGIAHAPSLPLAIALARTARRREQEVSGPWDIVVFGAPEHSDVVRERWPRLQAVPLDAKVLRELGGGAADERVHVIAGRDATLAALADPRVGSAGLLQFVTHGVFDIALDEPAGVVVWPGSSGQSVAWRSDLRGLRAPRVVALWVCGAQRGPARYGDDTASHLGGAFLEANACSVVVSPADVALGAGLAMGRRFALELSRGQPPVEAARAARAEVAANGGTTDPYYYASVVLYGDAGLRGSSRPRRAEVVRDDHKPRGWNVTAAAIIVFAMLAAAALGWWLVARRRARRA